MNLRTSQVSGLLVACGLLGTVAGQSLSRHVVREATLDGIDLHIEVDLPLRWGHDVGAWSSGGVLLLPAELELTIESANSLRSMRVLDGAGNSVLDVDASGPQGFALNGFKVESGGITLGELLGKYPAGSYQIEALGMDSRLYRGTAELQHEFPGVFSVVTPAPDQVLPVDAVTISWTPSSAAARYILEVEDANHEFEITVALPASVTSFDVPAALLNGNREYEYSLQVQGDTDNELEVEGSFRTEASFEQGAHATAEPGF